VGVTVGALAATAIEDPLDVAQSQAPAVQEHHEVIEDVGRLLASGRRLRTELREPFHLDRVSCPVLVVWGERDRMVSPTGADRLLEGLADVDVEVIEGCGHCPQIEEPEQVVTLLEEFCDRVGTLAT